MTDARKMIREFQNGTSSFVIFPETMMKQNNRRLLVLLDVNICIDQTSPNVAECF